MFFIWLLIRIIIFILKPNEISEQKCVWNLNSDLPKRDPIYINASNNYFLIPEESGLILNLNQNISLVCSGDSNRINGTELKEITASCTRNNLLFYSGKTYTFKSLECTRSTSSILEFSRRTCGMGSGQIIRIGFNSSKGTTYLLDVCYDDDKETALYTNSVIYGTGLKGAERDSARPRFRSTGLKYEKTTANLYKRKEQLKRFTVLLGSNQTEKYINNKSFLSRGHLAPDGDFLFGSWSFATYFLVNIAPQWQAVNGGNWVEVEKMVRAIAIKRYEDLQIFTGTHQVLQLSNESGDLVDIFLMEPNKLRVPKWYWKIVYSSETKQGIALISLNNPHVNSLEPDEIFCKDICQKTKWYKNVFSNFSKGFTFCCNVNDLIRAVGTFSPMDVKSDMIGPL